MKKEEKRERREPEKKRRRKRERAAKGAKREGEREREERLDDKPPNHTYSMPSKRKFKMLNVMETVGNL